MPRGQTSELGAKRTAPNGYHYIRTETGWRLEHHVIAEATILRRPLLSSETVRFRDGDKSNLHPDNLLVAIKGNANLRKRLAILNERIRELTVERDEILKKLALEDS